MRPKDDLKQAAIEQATYQLVQEQGLVRLKMADIARAAGLAASTLYVYYPSKQDLLDSLYQQAKSRSFQRLIAQDDPGKPLKARIRTIWHNMVDNRLQYPQELVFMEQYHSSAFLSASSRELSSNMQHFFADLLLAGQQSEQLKPLPLPLLMASVQSSVRDLSRLIQDGVLSDGPDLRQAAFSLCWDALCA
ncbi:TetR/AcrR family transcriptional regulator [Leeia sp.]|uniref:TetR/AcrR family transcriptional regulator n=1 Tax=Leeia sp. TaxID=2884678 RepID=UPI0035B4176B